MASLQPSEGGALRNGVANAHMLPSAQAKGGLRNDREVGNVGHCDLGMIKEEDLVGASSRDSGGEKWELILTPL